MRVIAIVKHCMILVALSIYIQAASQAMCDQPLEEANQTMLYMMDVCRDQLLQRALESGTASDLAIALSQVRRDEPMRVLLIASLQMVARQGCWLKMYVLLEDLKPFWMQIKSTLGHAFILASKKNHMEMARNLHLRCRDLGMRRHLSFGVAAAARNKHWDLSFYLCFGSIHFGATYQNDALAHLLEAAFDYNASEVIRRFDTQIVYCSQCVIPNIPDFVKNKSRDEVIHFLIVTYEEESFSYDKWSLRILLQSIIKHRHCNLLKRLVADDFSLHNGCKDQLRLEIVKAALLVGCSELALQVFPLIPKDIEMIGEVTDLAAACRDEEFLFKLKSLCSCGDFQSQCNSLLMDSFSLTGNPLHQLLWWQMADEQSTVNSTSLFEVVDFTQSMDCVLAHEDSSHDIAFPSQQDESEHLMKQSADHHHGQRFWWARSFSTVLKLHHWDSTLDLLRHATPRSFQRVFPKYVATLFQLGNVEIMFHVLCLLVIKADALEIFKKSAQHLLVRNDYDSMKQLLLLTPWSKMKALHVQIISNYMLNDHWYQSVFDSLSSGNLVDMYDLALQTIAAYGTRPKDLLFQVIVLQIALMRPERMHLIHGD